MIQIGTLQKSFLSALATGLVLSQVLGCGQKDVNSAGLTLQVLPQQSYLLPGSGSSCTDYQNLKVAIETPGTTTAPTLSSSISKLRVNFPAFGLTWSNSTTLYVAYIVFTIKAPQISGGTFSTSISGGELSALLGKTSNTFNGKGDMANSTDLAANPLAVGTIFSNDPARDCNSRGVNVISGASCKYYSQIFSSTYSACGLAVGGITIPSDASQFTAPFTLRLVGFSTDSNYKQTPLQTEVSGTVSYAGFQ